LAQVVKQVRHQLEKDLRNGSMKEAPKEITDTSDQESVNRLPVNVLISTLPEWAQIKRTIDSVPGVSRTDVITLQRGMTNVEIEFHGSVENLQSALAHQNLILQQDPSGAWTLHPVLSSGRP
jgi:hypothetical protein